MMIQKIKERWSHRVIFSAETKTMRRCVELAVEKGINLFRADLSRWKYRYKEIRFPSKTN